MRTYFRLCKFALSKRYTQKVLGVDRSGIFKQLFGNKERFATLLKSPFLDKIKVLLEEKGYRVDLDKSLAYKKNILLNGEEKWVPIKLGKVIGRELGQNFLQQYSKTGQYSIIFSKNAIDVVRMSDHIGITSCHSPGGSYFYCAINEAINGGAVAYLVKTEDLQKVNLDDPEIFEDQTRNVKGIRPISRVRLRRLCNTKTGEELAIPEQKMYGNKISNFLESVIDIARKKQADLFKKYRGAPRYEHFILYGGGYTDTNTSKLTNIFFKDQQDTKNLRNAENHNHAAIWQAEIDDILDIKLRYGYLYATAEEEEENVFIYTTCGIYIPWILLNLEKSDVLPLWNNEDTIQDINRLLSQKCFDGLYIQDTRLNERGIQVQFEYSVDNPDDLKGLSAILQEFDENILKIAHNCRNILINCKPLQKVYEDILPLEDMLSNFKVFDEHTNVRFNTCWHIEVPMRPYTENIHGPHGKIFGVTIQTQNANIKDKITSYIENILLPISKTKEHKEQTLFGEDTFLLQPFTNNNSGEMFTYEIIIKEGQVARNMHEIKSPVLYNVDVDLYIYTPRYMKLQQYNHIKNFINKLDMSFGIIYTDIYNIVKSEIHKTTTGII